MSEEIPYGEQGQDRILDEQIKENLQYLMLGFIRSSDPKYLGAWERRFERAKARKDEQLQNLMKGELNNKIRLLQVSEKMPLDSTLHQEATRIAILPEQQRSQEADAYILNYRPSQRQGPLQQIGPSK